MQRFSQIFSRRQLGDIHEQKAKHCLQQAGLEFVESNFNCKFGEIDLIFRDSSSQLLVFVEVRYRKSDTFGGAAASVSKSKQEKIKKSALFYVSQRKLAPNMRFDVVAIEGEQFNWIQSAFS